jgi:hypothetical protein
MINYNFEKPILEVKLIDGDLEKVITQIHYRYYGIDENDTYSDVYGVVSLPSPNNENFIDFNEIKEDPNILYEWLENILDIQSMQENIFNQINLINNPSTIIVSI